MYKSVFIFLIFVSFFVKAQKPYRHDVGINAAGLFIKNQPTILPGFIYNYHLNNYQLRAQIAFNAKTQADDRSAHILNNFNGDEVIQDSNFHYNPVKNIGSSATIGAQKKQWLIDSKLNYYFGVDLIFSFFNSSKSGTGNTTFSNFGFNQNVQLKLNSNSQIAIGGLGVPIGFCYRFGKSFYTSIESKFIVVYQKEKRTNNIESENNGVITYNNSTTNSKSFDVGFKPLSGLCLGYLFK